MFSNKTSVYYAELIENSSKESLEEVDKELMLLLYIV